MTRRAVAVLTVLGLTMSGCAGTARPGDAPAVSASVTSPAATSPSATSPSEAAPPPLPIVGAWTVEAGDGYAIAEHFTPRLEVTAAGIAATSGCRMFTAPLSADTAAATTGGLVTVTGGPVTVGSREHSCADDLNANEDRLSALIGGPMRWELTGDDRATVTGADDSAVTVRRTLAPDPDDPSVFSDPGLEGSFALLYWTTPDDWSPASVASSAEATAEPAAPPPPPTLVVTFADGRITAQGRCLTVTGNASLAAGHLQVDGLDTVASPDGNCDPSLRLFDERVVGLLAGGPVIERRDGDEVSLSSRDEQNGVTLSRIAVPADTAFADRDWVLQTWQRTGAPAEPTPGGVRAVLRYSDNRLWMTGGCNGAGGSAYIADGRIRVNDLMSTAKGCGSPLEDVDDVMTAPFAGDPPAYRIDGDTLTITGTTMTLVYESE